MDANPLFPFLFFLWKPADIEGAFATRGPEKCFGSMDREVSSDRCLHAALTMA